MLRWFASLALIGLLLVRHVHGFGSGAPASQCSTMLPLHGSLPGQSSPIPFTLRASSAGYTRGGIVTVTLSSDEGRLHKGFLIKVEDSSGNVIGTMLPSTNQKAISCGMNGNDAVTHTEKTDKQTSTFSWQAPGNIVGDVTFKSTVVEGFVTFWVNHDLLVLSEASADTTTAAAGTTTDVTDNTTLTQTTTPDGTTIQTTRPVQVEESDVITLHPIVFDDVVKVALPSYPWAIDMNGEITFDPECGSSKGCFVNCEGQSCDFMVTWRDIGNAIRFEIYGRPDGAAPEAWVAVGFSTDTRMGEDSVTECIHTNGVIQAFNSYNPGYSNVKVTNPQRGLSQIQGNYVNGVLMCSFVREKRVLNVPQVFDLEQDWHIMYANGRALSVPAWSISMHSLSSDNYPQTSAVKVDYQSFVVVGSGAKYPLVKAHGCLMIFAWVLFTGVGIVAARYYKNVWGDKTFMKLKIWFQVHRFSMVAAVLCNAIAFIIIFVEVGGYSEIPDIPGKAYLRSHPVLGIIITILSLANPVMALFRPGPDHSNRPIFNWAHWGIGMAAYILSTICICFGFQLGKSHTPDYAIYIMIAYVIYIILFDICLELMDILSKREKKGKVEQVEMSTTASNGADTAIPNGNTASKGNVKTTDRTKTILLAVHFAFTGTFALVLVLVVALN